MDNDYQELVKKCRDIITCDTARISKPLSNGKMFLIIGFTRNTKEDHGQWVNQNGERMDFDYVYESVIASGYTDEELIDSTKEYLRLCGTTWEEYFSDLSAKALLIPMSQKYKLKMIIYTSGEDVEIDFTDDMTIPVMRVSLFKGKELTFESMQIGEKNMDISDFYSTADVYPQECFDVLIDVKVKEGDKFILKQHKKQDTIIDGTPISYGKTMNNSIEKITFYGTSMKQMED